MRPSRAFRSAMPSARHRIAITSLAAVMSKPVSRGTPSVRPPSPMTMSRSARSFMSTTRFQLARRASMPLAVSWWSALSTSAASRLCALETAWKSPLKCMLMSSTGTTSEAPPPAPPPFMPNVGPRLGSRSATAERTPIFASPCARPTLVVVLPSPAGVGVIADTSTSLPRRGRLRNDSRASFAFQRPYGSTCAGSMFSDFATSRMGFMGAHYRGRPPGRRDDLGKPAKAPTARAGNQNQARLRPGRKRLRSPPESPNHRRTQERARGHAVDTRSSMPWTESGPNAELLRQARSGDVDALLRILDPYKLPLWRACLAITQQQDEADRLFEDTIGCATQELSGAPDGQPLLLWLVRLARELDAHHARTSPPRPRATRARRA